MNRHAHLLNLTPAHAELLKANNDAKQGARRVAANPKRRAYMKHRRDTEPMFKVLCNLRCRTRAALFGKGKGRKTKALIGCTIPELKAHLEAQFKPGMTWENYGEWHIDHIKPCRLFNLLDEEEQKRCFNYTNLQPLWAAENFSKSGRYREPR